MESSVFVDASGVDHLEIAEDLISGYFSDEEDGRKWRVGSGDVAVWRGEGRHRKMMIFRRAERSASYVLMADHPEKRGSKLFLFGPGSDHPGVAVIDMNDKLTVAPCLLHPARIVIPILREYWAAGRFAAVDGTTWLDGDERVPPIKYPA